MRLVLLLLILITRLHAGDWLRFRGPNGSGISEGGTLPTEFGPGRNMAWRTEVPFGRSSPVVAGDLVFLTASEGENLVTICLDRPSGRVLWRRGIPRARKMDIYKNNDSASPTPVSDGKNVYAFFAEFGLVSYGADGNERWRMPLGPFQSFYGLGASPVLAGTTLLLVCDHRANPFLLAVDSRSGKQLWKTPRANLLEGYSTPVIYSPPREKAQVLVFGSGMLDSYELETGKRLWWVDRVGYLPKGVPVLGKDMVYVSAPGSDEPTLPPAEMVLAKYDANGDGKVQREELKSDPYFYEHFGFMDANGDGAVDADEYNRVRMASATGHGLTAIRLGGSGNLTTSNVAWRFTKSYPNIPAPLLYGDVLYMVKTGGIVTTLDPMTGEVHKAGRIEKAMEGYYSSPVAAGGKVIFVSESGKVAVVRAGAEWEVMAVNDLEEEAWATPAIADGRLYVRTRKVLYCFEDSAGKR